MQIGPRYKKARYLGAALFHKTQSQKYAMREQRKTKNTKRRAAKSEYGKQMMEKQKARFSYGVGGRQFSNYVVKALETAGDHGKALVTLLERRLDNVVLRAGFAPSRSAARQMVSHGHMMVNGKIVTIPSYSVRVGDKITIREGSKSKALFRTLTETLGQTKSPAWIQVTPDTKEIAVSAEPQTDMSELLFDVGAVLEFYTR